MKAMTEQDFTPEPAWWQAFDESEATVVNQYVWGARPGHRDELILRDRVTTPATSETSSDPPEPAERLWSLMDYYDPTSAVNTEGEVVERYRFSAFGLRSILAPDFSPRSVSRHDRDFAFKGQFLDSDTGYYNYGYRYYSPELGRWLSRDPIGEVGGSNLYGMVGNDALNMLDKDGLGVPVVIGGAAAAVVAAAAACGLWDYLKIDDWYPGAGDRFKYCYIACKISKRCGGILVHVAGLGHEVLTEIANQLIPDTPDAGKRLRDAIGDIQANGQCVGWETYVAGPLGGWIGACFRQSCEECCDERVGRNTWGI